MKKVAIINLISLLAALSLAVAMRPTPPMSRSHFLVEHGIQNKEDFVSGKNSFICRHEGYICSLVVKPGTCCHNTCVDLDTDVYNCGVCNGLCGHLETCCGGRCYNLGLDDYNCGACNKKCPPGTKCNYGICGFA